MSATSTHHKPRIAFIDALRGFTMLLVVYSHIQFFGYQDTTGMNEIFIKFRMPLFFFISGWVLYKKDRDWNNKTALTFLFTKFKVQIISTLIFFFLYIYIFHVDILSAIDHNKSGYWFTYTLFAYFIFYVVSIRISRLFKAMINEDIIVLTLTLAIIGFHYYTIHDDDLHHQWIYGSIGVPQWKYYAFFVFGTMVRKYYKTFVSITDNPWLTAFCVSLFFLILVFKPFSSSITFSFYVLGFLGVVIVFTVFRIHEEWFTANKNISRWMQYIGRHTLDIYLLHYFFLPRNLEMIGVYFKDNSNATIELFFSISIALMVIGVCLLVSKVLCISPLLAKLLFGKK